MAYRRGRTLASHGQLFGPFLVDSGVNAATIVFPMNFNAARGVLLLGNSGRGTLHLGSMATGS